MIASQIRDASETDLTDDAIDAAIDGHTDELFTVVESLWITVATDFGERTNRAVRGQTKDFGEEFRAQLDMLIKTTVASVVATVNATTSDAVVAFAEAFAAQEGVTISDVRRELLDRFVPISETRAERIARTEVMRSSNTGLIEAARASDIRMKKRWLPTPGTRTRPSHRAMYQHPAIPLDEAFRVGASRMMQPGDGSLGAGPEEIVNCRCTLLIEPEA